MSAGLFFRLVQTRRQCHAVRPRRPIRSNIRLPKCQRVGITASADGHPSAGVRHGCYSKFSSPSLSPCMAWRRLAQSWKPKSSATLSRVSRDGGSFSRRRLTIRRNASLWSGALRSSFCVTTPSLRSSSISFSISLFLYKNIPLWHCCKVTTKPPNSRHTRQVFISRGHTRTPRGRTCTITLPCLYLHAAARVPPDSHTSTVLPTVRALPHRQKHRNSILFYHKNYTAACSFHIFIVILQRLKD